MAGDTGAAPVWPAISAAELAASLAVVAGFYLAAVYVVGRDRRGDAWSLAWLNPGWWAQRVGDRVSAAATAASPYTPRSFRSPRAAQFWMEWRSKGRYVPLTVAGAFVVLWVVAAFNRLQWYSLSGALGVLAAMFLITSPFVGVYLGHRSQRFDMRPFLATRPLSDGEQAMVVLRHVAAVCGAGLLVWLIGFAVTTTLWGRPFPFLPTTWGEAKGLLVQVGLLPLVVWALAALGATLGMARSWFVPVGGLGGGVLLMILIGIAGRAPPLFAEVATLVLAAGSLGGTAAAFVAARRRRLISLPMVLGALAAYVVLVTACLLVARGVIYMPPEAVLRTIGFCAVPLAPLAAAPLALAWNRHR